MPHAEASVLVSRSPKDVYDFVLAGENNKLWRPLVTDTRRLPGTPSGAGAHYVQGVDGPGGRRVNADYEITRCEEGKVIEFRVTEGPARPMGRYLFEPEGEGTRVTLTFDIELTSLTRVMESMIDNQMQLDVLGLAQLKQYLESPPQESPEE